MSDTPDVPAAAACGVCGSPTGDSANLCRTHTDDLRDRITPVPVLVQDLEVTLTRQSRTTQQDGGRSTETPLPWNENASAKAFELNATLNAWALDTSRLGEDERDLLADVRHTDTALVAEWLIRNLPTLRQHPEAGQAYDEITESIREAHRAIDRPADPTPFGECGTQHVDVVCRTVLYGYLDRPTVSCPGCGVQHSTAERLVWMLDHLRGMLATIPELVGIARLAGKRTSDDKLRLMASRGRFEQIGDNRGKPTYRVADVLKALDERYKHRPTVAGAA